MLLVAQALAMAEAAPRARPGDWVQPATNATLSNFYKVSDYVYRSEQPDDDQMRMVEKMGIIWKTTDW